MSTLQYKGVNLSGLEFGSGTGQVNRDYVMPGKDSYDYWAQHVDSNIVRLPFTWERLQPQLGGALNQDYLSYLKSSVEYAKANGMTVILDLHNYARFNGQVVTAAQLTDVWTKLGKEFDGNPSVWLNLMNEPHDISATQWANTSQQTLNALRAEGIDNKVLISGTSWSGAHSWISSGNGSAFANFKDPLNNYAYDVHQYLDSDSSGTSATAVSGAGSTRLVDITAWAEATGQKLFLGETGVADNAQSQNEMTAMIKYMEAHSDAWLGFTLWGAGPWWPDNYVFEINPNGSVDDASIAKLMSLLSPAGGTDPGTSPGTNPGTDPGTSPGTGVTIDLNHGADNIQGTAGNDVVAAWYAQVETGDIVKLGAGVDTLLIRNTGLPLVDTTGLTGFSGVDRIDITASDGWARVLLTEAFIAQSDNKSITVAYGNAGIGAVEVATANKSSYQFEYGDHQVKVTYKPPATPGTDPGTNPGTDPGTSPGGGGSGQTLNGTSKGETMHGGSGDDTVNGNGGADYLYGGDGNDTLYGGAGADKLYGDTGNDKINGDDSSDYLYGGAGSDALNGGAGDDRLYGNDGNDLLTGGAGNDYLYGEAGNDIMVAGLGRDSLYGSTGSDTFALDAIDGSMDYFNDFVLKGSEADKIDISDVLSGFGAGDRVSDFVMLKTFGTSRAELMVNQDGAGNDWVKAASVTGSNFSHVTAEDLMASGQLIVA